MKRVVLLIVGICFTVFSFAQDAAEIVEQANTAVENKDYAKAVELFESVLTMPDHGQDEDNINKVLNQLRPVVAKDKANDAIDAKEYDKAVDLYKAAMKDYPDDASIVEQAGIKFYNAGIASYKGEEYLEAAKCFSIAENEFKYEKAEKYKIASLSKIAEGLASENKTSVEEINLSDENKELLVKSLAKEYFDEGYDLYKQGADIIKQATDKVNAGSITTLDDEYKNAIAEGKKVFENAKSIIEKTLSIDSENGNAKTVLDACVKQLAQL